MNEYLGELRQNWRALVSVTLGVSCGLVLFGYTAGIMGPALVREFGWSSSLLALIPSFSATAIFVYPFVGRLADTIGPRATASIGVIASPLIYFALSVMQNFATYATVLLFQCIFLLTTTPQVYCRVVVQYFDKARGLALAITSLGTPLLAAVAAPLVNNFVADHGWRAGYLAISLYTLVLGATALIIMPPAKPLTANASRTPTARADFTFVFGKKAFWILAISMFLVNMPQMPLLTQMNLVLAEAGAPGKAASALLSAYASGMIIGRFISGVALDRLPPREVSVVCLAISAFGFLLLSLHLGSHTVLLIAMLLVGLAYGTETDILGFLVHRYFGMRVYSTAYSMVGAAITISAVSGGIALSLFLDVSGKYWPFLTMSSGSILIGSVLLLLLPREGIVETERSVVPAGDRPLIASPPRSTGTVADAVD